MLYNFLRVSTSWRRYKSFLWSFLGSRKSYDQQLHFRNLSIVLSYTGARESIYSSMCEFFKVGARKNGYRIIPRVWEETNVIKRWNESNIRLKGVSYRSILQCWSFRLCFISQTINCLLLYESLPLPHRGIFGHRLLNPTDIVDANSEQIVAVMALGERWRLQLLMWWK